MRLFLTVGLAACLTVFGGLVQTALSAPEPPDDKAPPAPLDPAAIARGKKVYEAYCRTCHSVSGVKGVGGGPLDGMWGTEVELEEGDPVTYDEEFFRESLTTPAAKLTKGYANQMAPFEMSEPDTADLIAYVKSLSDAEIVRKTEQQTAEKRAKWLAELPAPEARIRYIYVFCNDLSKMRLTYSTCLSLQEIEYTETHDEGRLVYRTGGPDLMIMKWGSELPAETRWAWQPGGGTPEGAPITSFAIDYPLELYRRVVQTVAGAGPLCDIQTQTDVPMWRQGTHWSWTIRDAGGNTIELTCTPEEQPKDGETPKWKE